MGLFKRAGRPADSAPRIGDCPAEPAQAAGVVAPESYRRTETVTVPWRDESALVHVRGAAAAQVLPRFIAELQRHCDTFRPLREHAMAICEVLGLSHRDVGAIEAHLAVLAASGVLTSKTQVLDGCRARASAAPEPRRAIAATVVVTRDRPEAAQRCLLDFVRLDKQAGRTGEFAVFDDSPDADVRRQYREALRAVAQREAVEVGYAGREEKQRFVDALLSEGGSALPRSVVEFALFGAEDVSRVIGANRNASLLHTVGDAFLCTDDDTRGRMAESPDADDRLALVSANDPTDFWFYPDREAAFAAARFSDQDPWTFHERLLGRDLASCVAEGAEAVDLDGASDGLLAGLMPGEGRVRATASGIVGDCGMGAPTYYLHLRGEARARLIGAGAGYPALRSTRDVLRVVPRWTIAESPFFMATSVGLDNRTLLPPFFPVQVNEDGIFGATLRAAFEQGFIGHLPFAIQHDPVERRTFGAAGGHGRPASLHTPQVVLHCLAAHAPSPVMRDPALRLRALGRHVQACGALAPGAFEEFLRLQHWRHLGASIASLEGALAEVPDGPAEWTADVRGAIEAAHACLTAPEALAPADLVSGRSAVEAMALVQRLLVRFGELLEHWSDIHEAAGALRRRGERLAPTL
jgi:hypothetical protein